MMVAGLSALACGVLALAVTYHRAAATTAHSRRAVDGYGEPASTRYCVSLAILIPC